MPSSQITLKPSRRVAARFVGSVRRAIQKALAEEFARRGLTQSDIARELGVNRSVIHRQVRGFEDITVSRIAELAYAMGRSPVLQLPHIAETAANHAREERRVSIDASAATEQDDGPGAGDVNRRVRQFQFLEAAE